MSLTVLSLPDFLSVNMLQWMEMWWVTWTSPQLVWRTVANSNVGRRTKLELPRIQPDSIFTVSVCKVKVERSPKRTPQWVKRTMKEEKTFFFKTIVKKAPSHKKVCLVMPDSHTMKCWWDDMRLLEIKWVESFQLAFVSLWRDVWKGGLTF